jgi:hypothetical protein
VQKNNPILQANLNKKATPQYISQKNCIFAQILKSITMIELVLRLPSLRVLDKLLPLLKQMNISYQTRTIEPILDNGAMDDDIFVKIQNGALDLPNFEETMTAFEESRQDRDLYGRN